MAAISANLLKRMKLGGPRRAKKLVPGIRPKSNDAREARLYIAKLNGAYEPGKTRDEGSYRRVGVLLRANADNQKDCRACERTDHSLRENDLVKFLGRFH